MKRIRNLVCGALAFTFGSLAVGCIIGAANGCDGTGALVVLAVLMTFGCYLFSEVVQG